jgi:hypothetical protein
VHARLRASTLGWGWSSRTCRGPGNGKPFPDGSKMAKISWKQKKSTEAPDPNTVVPDTLHGVA